MATESTQAQILRAIGALKDELLREIGKIREEARAEFVTNALANQRQSEVDARLKKLEERPVATREWIVVGVAVLSLVISACSTLAFIAQALGSHWH